MNDSEENSYRLTHTSNLTPKVAYWYSQMFEVRNRLINILKSINDTSVLDFSPNEHKIETIGTLLLHIAAVEWSWIFEDIDGLKMDYEQWKYAFALKPSVKIPQLTGKNLNYYLDRLTDVRKQVHKRLLEFTDEDLNTVVSEPPYTYTVEWIFFHLVEHEAMHIGQINVLKRLYEIKKSEKQ